MRKAQLATIDGLALVVLAEAKVGEKGVEASAKYRAPRFSEVKDEGGEVAGEE